MDMHLRIVLVGLFLIGCAHHPVAPRAEVQQLLVILADGWQSPVATATLYERDGNEWRTLASSAAVVGKNGLGWGLGVAAPLTPGADDPVKKEGDGKAPAGVFHLGSAFGNSPPRGAWPFRELKTSTECVDDVTSEQYNQVVENNTVTVNWKSSEKMASEPLYRLGAFVEHNWPNVSVGAGSCIFLHVWRERGRGTAGCTAFDEASLREVLELLRPEARPLLIQLPRSVYDANRVEARWP
jgi:D-alanyl-D-alanine dipeptidase